VNCPSYQMFSKLLRNMEITHVSGGNSNSPQPKRAETEHSAKTLTKGSIKIDVSESVAKTVLNIGLLLHHIRIGCDAGEDVYDLVKEYVDLAQHPDFKLLNFILTARLSSSSTPGLILTAIKLERWGIMTLFYFLCNTRHAQAQVKLLLKEILKVALDNACLVNSILSTTPLTSDKLQASKKCLLKLASKEGSASASRSHDSLLRANCDLIKELVLQW